MFRVPVEDIVSNTKLLTAVIVPILTVPAAPGGRRAIYVLIIVPLLCKTVPSSEAQTLSAVKLGAGTPAVDDIKIGITNQTSFITVGLAANVGVIKAKRKTTAKVSVRIMVLILLMFSPPLDNG